MNPLLTPDLMQPPRADDVVAALDAMRPQLVRTPLLESAEINSRCGARVIVKAETLQHTGSYKFRGATNRLRLLDADERSRGVVSYSTGNFAQAVAAAAKALGVSAKIIVPHDTPKVKLERTRAFGAEIVFYDRTVAGQREAMAQEIAEAEGRTIVPSGNDAAVLAGYGTVGAELLEQLAEPIGAILVPCGSGGLTSGITACVAEKRPSTQIFAVEPEGFDDVTRSLAAGERLSNAPGAKTMCDALTAQYPAELPFRVLRGRARGLVVSDAEVAEAMRLAFDHFHLVVEPGGAVALAAALQGRVPVRGGTLVVIASGANVDRSQFADILRLNLS